MKDKLIINLILYVLKLKNYFFIQQVIKNIYYDYNKCINNYEIQVKRFSNSSVYIFNSINQTFNEELIKETYFLLTYELLDDDIVDEIIKLYYKNIDLAPHSLTALIHLYILNNVKNYNTEFAFLISNYIMLKKERGFLIPYEYCHNEYREAIKNNDLSSLIRMFYSIETTIKEKKPCLLSRNEVIQKIKCLREKLLSSYNIEKLYLFGSFAKENNTENSDLDFVVIFNETLINKEKNDMTKQLRKYLSNEFNCDVDIVDFNYALDSFDKSQMEYLTTLI